MIFLSAFNFKNAVGTVPINKKCMFVSTYGKILIGCLLILSAQGLLENSAD